MEILKKIKSGVLSYLYYTDWMLLFACLLATAYGVILVYSAAYAMGTGTSGYLVQIIAGIVGIALAIVISTIDYEWICKAWPILDGIAVILVLLTFTKLGLNVSGSTGTNETCWIRVPLIGTFQPSELLKITFIISFATHLSKVHERLNELLVVALLCVHGAIPVGLMLLEGDAGMALVFICIFVSMLLVAGLRPLYFLIAMTGGAAMVPVVWKILSPDRKARILSIIFVDQYAQSTGFQQYWGLVALGSGKLWGTGFLQSSGNNTIAHSTDMIFTVAGEEFGFVGTMVLLGIILFIILALLREVLKARDYLGMLLCSGILSMIAFQSIINIGMTLRLLPVIGITLPFFSRGGSSLVTLYLGIGVALSVYYSSRAKVRNTIFVKKTFQGNI